MIHEPIPAKKKARKHAVPYMPYANSRATVSDKTKCMTIRISIHILG